jgi:hypothetical protein
VDLVADPAAAARGGACSPGGGGPDLGPIRAGSKIFLFLFDLPRRAFDCLGKERLIVTFRPRLMSCPPRLLYSIRLG